MAEAVRNGRIAFLRMFGKLFASILSLLGVVSGCDTMSADYGVQSTGVYAFGQTLSATDISHIEGIQVRLSSPDSTQDYDLSTTNSSGYYDLHIDTRYIPLPDSVRLIATDIDGADNGSFEGRDTLLFPDPELETQDFYVDLFLTSDD